MGRRRRHSGRRPTSSGRSARLLRTRAARESLANLRPAVRVSLLCTAEDDRSLRRKREELLEALHEGRHERAGTHHASAPPPSATRPRAARKPPFFFLCPESTRRVTLPPGLYSERTLSGYRCLEGRERATGPAAILPEPARTRSAEEGQLDRFEPALRNEHRDHRDVDHRTKDISHQRPTLPLFYAGSNASR